MIEQPATQTPPTTLAAAPPEAIAQPATVATRPLTGFVDEETGLNLLLGPRRGMTTAGAIAAAQETLRQQRAAVAARPIFTAGDPRIASADDQALTVAATRGEMHSRLHPLSWRIGYVDLTRVIAYQPVVRLEGMDTRLQGARDDLTWLLDFALPVPAPTCQMGVAVEPDGRAVTIASANPNLRLAGVNCATSADVQPMPHLPAIKQTVVQIIVGFGCPYIHVARLGDRWLLRDGYHRVVGLLQRGITRCPVVLSEFASWEAMGVQTGMIAREVVMGDRPPLLTDFWSDDVSAEGTAAELRKVVRITTQDFLVP